jgi:hypothetical protein
MKSSLTGNLEVFPERRNPIFQRNTNLENISLGEKLLDVVTFPHFLFLQPKRKCAKKGPAADDIFPENLFAPRSQSEPLRSPIATQACASIDFLT